MIAFLADENLNNDILRGLQSRNALIDIVRAQDVGLSGAEDPSVLDWAAFQNRVLLTHDVRTIPHYATERIKNALPMPGVICMTPFLSLGKAIDDLELIAVCSDRDDCQNQVVYLPLK